jgi:hypothetical protein
MLVLFVAIALLIASVAAIYLLLKSMGQEGVEIAAPGSCKSGRCGVRKDAGVEAGCRQEELLLAEADEIKELSAPDGQHALAEREGSRSG